MAVQLRFVLSRLAVFSLAIERPSCPPLFTFFFNPPPSTPLRTLSALSPLLRWRGMQACAALAVHRRLPQPFNPCRPLYRPLSFLDRTPEPTSDRASDAPCPLSTCLSLIHCRSSLDRSFPLPMARITSPMSYCFSWCRTPSTVPPAKTEPCPAHPASSPSFTALISGMFTLTSRDHSPTTLIR